MEDAPNKASAPWLERCGVIESAAGSGKEIRKASVALLKSQAEAKRRQIAPPSPLSWRGTPHAGGRDARPKTVSRRRSRRRGSRPPNPVGHPTCACSAAVGRTALTMICSRHQDRDLSCSRSRDRRRGKCRGKRPRTPLGPCRPRGQCHQLCPAGFPLQCRRRDRQPGCWCPETVVQETGRFFSSTALTSMAIAERAKADANNGAADVRCGGAPSLDEGRSLAGVEVGLADGAIIAGEDDGDLGVNTVPGALKELEQPTDVLLSDSPASSVEGRVKPGRRRRRLREMCAKMEAIEMVASGIPGTPRTGVVGGTQAGHCTSRRAQWHRTGETDVAAANERMLTRV